MKTIGKKSVAWVLGILLALSCCLGAGLPPDTVNAETSGDFSYELLADDTAIITGYTGSAAQLEIPAQLDGHPVVAIGESAFADKQSIQTLSLPDTLVRIDYQAFSGCRSLTTLTIPESVREINGYAFQGCINLGIITLPDTPLAIREYAFLGTAYHNNQENWQDGLLYIGNHLVDSDFALSGDVVIREGTVSMAGYSFHYHFLSSLSLPASLQVITDGAFWYAEIDTIAVAADSPYFKVQDGVLFTQDGRELLYYPPSKTDSSYTIPAGVEIIRYGAFTGNESLTSLTLPEGLVELGDYALDGCNGLTSLTLPANLRRLGNYAIEGDSLTAITVAQGNEVFVSQNGVLFSADGTQLLHYPNGKADSSYTIPQGVASIANGAFNRNPYLTAVSFPNSLESVGDSAFYGCTGLQTIPLPDKVLKIGNAAFGNTGYANNQDNWDNGALYVGAHLVQSNGSGGAMRSLRSGNESLAGELMVRDGTKSIADSACAMTDITSLYIPDSVGYIGEIAFSNCGQLTSVRLPAGLTRLEEGTFSFCSSLSSITLPNTLTYLGERALYNTALTSITVPAGVTEIGIQALGYYYDNEVNFTAQVREGYVIRGYEGTAAQAYANHNGITFVALGQAPDYDLDQDGSVSVGDVMTLALAVVNFTSASAMDFNADGLVDVLDVMTLAQVVANQ